ncbi:putative WRKY transcription factor 2 [Forsythia ovata]|uniref:WRKY transcription factor 2 n=1 Tax=Forsythia ovata TaxID=205694 RepID=A0ABD1S4X6_9LAMI
MGGFDDHVAIMGDWISPISSPRAFFSSVIDIEAMARSIPESDSDNRSRTPFSGPEMQGASRNTDLKDKTLNSVVADEMSKSNALSETKTSSHGSLMERMIARAGFNAPRLNTENIRLDDIPRNPEVQSPYLTIPPGLSPTTLLDSPLFVSDSQILPSPTTGKFSLTPSGKNQNSAMMTDNPDKCKKNIFEDANAASFAFQPVTGSSSALDYGAATKANPYQQSVPSIEVSSHSENSLQPEIVELHNISLNYLLRTQTAASHQIQGLAITVGIAEHSSPLDEPQEADADQSSGLAGDGYNWRKYGQKQVKRSENPRSYYKCTHLNCTVKKKVERSHEGHVTEIIYKGAHNHPKPPPNDRSTIGSSSAVGDAQPNTTEPPGTVADGDQIWSTVQKAGAPDWRQDSLEPKSSAPVSNECSNGALSFQAHGWTQIESGEGVDGSSTFSNDEDEGGTIGSVSLGYDGEGDELESKRRRTETYASEMSGGTRGIREPRVVVQTISEVDILDDGYRWRKYGQKVVKGNPNPRSYYKCTSPGCNVRKHVERASHDLKSVITTYEGKHNHVVPAARNSNHVNSGIRAPAAAPSHIQRAEHTQIHNSMAHFGMLPSLGLFGLQGTPLFGPTPDFGFGMNQPMAGLPYFGQLHQMNETGFVVPKGEPKTEPVSDSGLDTSNSSSVYHQITRSRWPHGPQM